VTPAPALVPWPAAAEAPGPVSHVLGSECLADEQAARLARLIDPAFLAEAGWDPVGQVLAPPHGHPQLGWRPRRDSTGMPAGAWCAVRQCRRPAGATTEGLCAAHRRAQRRRGVPAAQFVADPARRALPSWGSCQVTACPRDRLGGNVRYCEPHQERWRLALAADPARDADRWQQTASPVPVTGQVSLLGMPPLMTVMVLYGLQQRVRSGVITRPEVLRLVVEDLRRLGASSLEHAELPPGTTTIKQKRTVLNGLARHARVALADPDTEKDRDVWELEVFGQNGRLTFTTITQPWLRAAAKRFAADELPRHRAGRTGGVMRSLVGSLARLSASLRATREDHGDVPALLGRADIETFLHRLAYLTSAGECSPELRTAVCRDVRRILGRIRALGLTRPGGPAARLGEDFTLAYGDIPAEPERPEPGRDLPAQIMRQLCEHLPLLEQAPSGREIRCAVELLTDTGRRPDEILRLPWDCLARDPDSSPVLIYDNHKRQRQGRRLPISQATANVITAQQKHVRERFPATPITELALLPAPHANPGGHRTISGGTLDLRHRTWIDQLPPLRSPDGTEFSKAKIVPYCYRHTYAQRHADAGVPIDVLRELMDHKMMDTTKRYYRVGEARRREAVDKVTAMQFDRHGNRIWRQAGALLDAERARYAIGEVAVPYGTCTEPSNVRAGGGACPIRFRCAGCDHFRADVSHLPDLTAYLDDLLRTRERLTAAIDGFDEWARADAAPAEEEITRIRRLITRIKGDVAQLTDTERGQVDEAIAVVRRHRAVHLGMPAAPASAVPLPAPRTEALA
jgi:integrase